MSTTNCAFAQVSLLTIEIKQNIITEIEPLRDGSSDQEPFPPHRKVLPLHQRHKLIMGSFASAENFWF